MGREPTVQGQFYPEDKEELIKQIEISLDKSPKGIKHEHLAAISPHAGYYFSGVGSASSFRALKKSPETIIILGFSHSGIGRDVLSLSSQDWSTPLGIIKTDKDLLEKFVDKGAGIVDDEAHMQEHSIEVQIPFIQHFFADSKILAVSVRHDCDFKEKGRLIASILEGSGRDYRIIASSDFTHFGPSFGYVPFRDNIKENLEKLDKGAIDYILKLDSRGFQDYIDRTGATICGSSPISLLIEISKNMGVKSGKLINYYTSADILGDYSSSVSYASIVF